MTSLIEERRKKSGEVSRWVNLKLQRLETLESERGVLAGWRFGKAPHLRGLAKWGGNISFGAALGGFGRPG